MKKTNIGKTLLILTSTISMLPLGAMANESGIDESSAPSFHFLDKHAAPTLQAIGDSKNDADIASSQGDGEDDSFAALTNVEIDDAFINIAPIASQAQSKMVSDKQSSDALADAAQNPVSSTISLPLQNNLFIDTGPNNKAVNVLNIQPVLPVKLSDGWNMITRTIIPVITIPSSIEGLDVLPEGVTNDTTFGLGDINFSAYFSPTGGGVTWGVGPSISIPTATDRALGTDKLSMGIGGVLFNRSGKWAYGAVVRNIWSVAGKDSRADVDQFMVQPFVNFNMANGWYLVSAPIITANWEKPSSDRWLVPLGGGIGKIFKIGNQPINAQISYYNNIEHADFGPEHSIRIQFQFIFPK